MTKFIARAARLKSAIDGHRTFKCLYIACVPPLHALKVDHDNAFSKTGFQYEIRAGAKYGIWSGRYRHREQAMMVYLRRPLERIANSDRSGMQLMGFAIAIVFIWIGTIKSAPYKADNVARFGKQPVLVIFLQHPEQ